MILDYNLINKKYTGDSGNSYLKDFAKQELIYNYCLDSIHNTSIIKISEPNPEYTPTMAFNYVKENPIIDSSIDYLSLLNYEQEQDWSVIADESIVSQYLKETEDSIIINSDGVENIILSDDIVHSKKKIIIDGQELVISEELQPDDIITSPIKNAIIVKNLWNPNSNTFTGVEYFKVKNKWVLIYNWFNDLIVPIK